MKITEHNLTNWELDECDIKDLIRLTREEMNKNPTDRIHQTHYGILLGKLLIMKNSNN